ncbi:MAG: hypothetical protein MHMPM18_002138 [Marteilia pararefringens]
MEMILEKRSPDCQIDDTEHKFKVPKTSKEPQSIQKNINSTNDTLKTCKSDALIRCLFHNPDPKTFQSVSFIRLLNQNLYNLSSLDSKFVTLLIDLNWSLSSSSDYLKFVRSILDDVLCFRPELSRVVVSNCLNILFKSRPQSITISNTEDGEETKKNEINTNNNQINCIANILESMIELFPFALNMLKKMYQSNFSLNNLHSRMLKNLIPRISEIFSTAPEFSTKHFLSDLICLYMKLENDCADEANAEIMQSIEKLTINSFSQINFGSELNAYLPMISSIYDNLKQMNSLSNIHNHLLTMRLLKPLIIQISPITIGTLQDSHFDCALEQINPQASVFFAGYLLYSLATYPSQESLDNSIKIFKKIQKRFAIKSDNDNKCIMKCIANLIVMFLQKNNLAELHLNYSRSKFLKKCKLHKYYDPEDVTEELKSLIDIILEF